MNAQNTGKKIAELRKEKELTQKDIAENLHVSIAAVSKWERGLNFPDLSLMEPLADILGITVSELLGLEGESADRVIRDMTELSESEKTTKKKNFIIRTGAITAAVALLAAISFAAYLSVTNNSLWKILFEFIGSGTLNLAAVVLSLLAFTLAVISIFIRKGTWTAFSLASLTCCASALLVPTIVTYLTIRFEYTSTIEDIIGADLFGSAVVFFGTVIFNLCSFLIHGKDYNDHK